MKEVLSLHFGQAGCQIGHAVWEQITGEHGISCNGTSLFESQDNLQDDDASYVSFFDTNIRNKHVPRAIYCDLEPSVLDEIRCGPYKNLYQPSQLISGKEDASDNFARGYFNAGAKARADVIEQLNNLLEASDGVEAIMMFRSLGGGTGAGFTASIFDQMHDMTKAPFIEFAVLPSSTLPSTSVAAYNAILTQHFCMDNMHLGILVDNESIFNIMRRYLDKEKMSFTAVNRLIAHLASNLTCTTRFKNTLNNDVNVLQTNLIPYPRIHFPLINFAPLLLAHRGPTHFSVPRITRGVFDASNQTVGVDINASKFMACSLIYRGQVSPMEVYTSIKELKCFERLKFVDWCPTGFKIGICHQPNYYVSQSDVGHSPTSVTMLATTGAVGQVVDRLVHNFGILYSKRSFVHWYVGEGLEESEFTEAFYNLATLVRDYEEVTRDTQELIAEHVENKNIEKQNNQQQYTNPTPMTCSTTFVHNKVTPPASIPETPNSDNLNINDYITTPEIDAVSQSIMTPTDQNEKISNQDKLNESENDEIIENQQNIENDQEISNKIDNAENDYNGNDNKLDESNEVDINDDHIEEQYKEEETVYDQKIDDAQDNASIAKDLHEDESNNDSIVQQNDELQINDSKEEENEENIESNNDNQSGNSEEDERQSPNHIEDHELSTEIVNQDYSFNDNHIANTNEMKRNYVNLKLFTLKRNIFTGDECNTTMTETNIPTQYKDLKLQNSDNTKEENIIQTSRIPVIKKRTIINNLKTNNPMNTKPNPLKDKYESQVLSKYSNKMSVFMKPENTQFPQSSISFTSQKNILPENTKLTDLSNDMPNVKYIPAKYMSHPEYESIKEKNTCFNVSSTLKRVYYGASDTSIQKGEKLNKINLDQNPFFPEHSLQPIILQTEPSNIPKQKKSIFFKSCFSPQNSKPTTTKLETVNEENTEKSDQQSPSSYPSEFCFLSDIQNNLKEYSDHSDASEPAVCTISSTPNGDSCDGYSSNGTASPDAREMGGLLPWNIGDTNKDLNDPSNMSCYKTTSSATTSVDDDAAEITVTFHTSEIEECGMIDCPNLSPLPILPLDMDPTPITTSLEQRIKSSFIQNLVLPGSISPTPMRKKRKVKILKSTEKSRKRHDSHEAESSKCSNVSEGTSFGKSEVGNNVTRSESVRLRGKFLD